MSQPINTPEFETLLASFKQWAQKCDALQIEMLDSKGEVREAYAKIHRHYLWKLQMTAGKLYYYLCGSKEINPYEPVNPPEGW
jgi:hypothetical protein